jgi:cytochrome b subunit of formate dehydrogenase
MYITNVLHWIMISCILQMFYTGLEFRVSYKGFTLVWISCILHRVVSNFKL